MNTFIWYIRTLIKMLLKRGVETSYSQFGEDVVVNAMLRSIQNGTYVDVGGFDPVLYSNTYLFYKKGWKGVVIEPNRTLKSKFSLIRHRDEFELCGVAESEKTMTYYKFNYPAYNTFDESARDSYLAGNSSLKVIGTERVLLRPLKDILAKNNISKVDFMNVDTQGFDLQVLNSMGTLRPSVIAVEIENVALDDAQKSPIYQFLTGIGYSLNGCAGVTFIFKLAL